MAWHPTWSRRTFLRWAGTTAVSALSLPLIPHLAAFSPQAARLEKWPPNSNVIIEWRYLAGRITTASEDIGFVISISFIRLPGGVRQELLVQRQDLAGDGAFVGSTYGGTLTYDAATAGYTFVDETAVSALNWHWDESQQQYMLSLSSPELTLTNLTLRPQGDLIAEGGDGQISVGRAQGVPIASNYDADWVTIWQGGSEVGVARLDMQGLRPGFLRQQPNAVQDVEPGGYDHSWFALAGELVNGTAVWLSTWRIEDDVSGPYWVATVATGSGASWQIAASLTESSSATPLQVRELAWQPLPDASSDQRAATAWHIIAPNNTFDLTLRTPPGQFTLSPRGADVLGQPFMVEAVGTSASGTVLGQPLTNVKLVVAESTHEFYTEMLPLVVKK